MKTEMNLQGTQKYAIEALSHLFVCLAVEKQLADPQTAERFRALIGSQRKLSDGALKFALDLLAGVEMQSEALLRGGVPAEPGLRIVPKDGGQG